MSFTGNLKTVTFPDLLQLFSTGKKTGTLIIVRGKIQKQLLFKEGNIFGASSRDAEEDFLGKILLRSGRLTKSNLHRAIQMQKTSGKRIGAVLIDMKLLTREELSLYLRQQVEEIIYNLFSWSEGEFIFKEGELPKHFEVKVELNTMNIVMEGMRRIDEWEEIQKVLPADNHVLRLAFTASHKSNELTLSMEEFTVVTLIDGKRTLPEILETSPLSEFVTSRVLYKLINAGLVESGELRDEDRDDPHEEDSLFWLLLRVYASAFNLIARTLKQKLGADNGKLLDTLGRFRSGIWAYFNGTNHADFPANFESLKMTIAKIPKEIRVLKLVSGLNQILEEQLAFVYSHLGIKIRKQVAVAIKKEIALPLAERREIDRKYDVGTEVYRILREVKLTKELL